MHPDLPKSEGFLATWQLIVATMAVFNTIQNFATLKLTRRLYTGVPSSSSKSIPPLFAQSDPRFSVTALQARTFAAWTLTSAIIRGYAAYNINNKTCFQFPVYQPPF